MLRRDLLRALPLTVFGASVSPSSLRSLVQSVNPDWEPMSDEEKIISALTEVIIPETDSPGAIAAGVPQFFLKAWEVMMTPEEKSGFAMLFEKFREQCITEHNNMFHEMSSAEQIGLLSRLESEEDMFFRQMKATTISIYFTTEAGMTQALRYNPIPGKYDPCIEVTDETRSEAMYF